MQNVSRRLNFCLYEKKYDLRMIVPKATYKVIDVIPRFFKNKFM